MPLAFFKKCLPIALLLLLSGNMLSLFAQNRASIFGVESNMMGGKIFKHTKKFTGPSPDFSGGMEVNLLWKTRGKADWQWRRNLPTVGLGLCYTYYDQENYGQSIGLYPNLEWPIYAKNNWEWTVRMGMGLGYISKQNRPYAPYWDTLNNAIGARINNFSLCSSELRYRINQQWDIQAGLSFTHMSSAKFRLPNLGINLLGGHVGIRYFTQKRGDRRMIQMTVPKLKNRWLLQARQGIALTTGESIGSAATPVFIGSLSMSKRYWGKNKIVSGVDYGYHQSVYDFMRIQAINPGQERASAWNLGLFVGHEFLYGRVGLYMQLGAYVKQTILPKAPIYQRLGMNWYIRQQEKGLVKEFYISTLLKTHYAAAEFAELGVGIGL